MGEGNNGIVFEPRGKYNHASDEKKDYDLAVVGLGVSGYSAAMYASRLGLKVLLIGEQPGGTLALTGRVENYPGFVSIEGQRLTELLENHALDYDVDLEIARVERIKKENSGSFRITCKSKAFSSRALILATGSELKKLGVSGEKALFGKGVTYCALCDAALIKGKTVAVVGGGDGAVKEAILVSEHAKKVYIVNNERELHPERQNWKILETLEKKGKIESINGNEIEKISGTTRVENIVLKQPYKGRRALSVQGVFVYIGSNPRSELAKSIGIKLNKKGEVVVGKMCETNVSGVFAAGDVTNTEWKQAIIGVSQGVTASYYAYQFLGKSKTEMKKAK